MAGSKEKAEQAAKPEKPEVIEGTFLSHLIELRNRVLRALLAVSIVFVGLVYFAQDIYTLVAQPMVNVLPEGTSMIATEVATPFLTPIKLTLWVSFVIAVPIVLYQLWAFVAPGLYRHERRMVWPLLASSTLLFYMGMAFAYLVVFPLAFSFFISFAPQGVTVMTDIRAYLDFVFSMFLAFGVAFEVPVAIVLLVRMGVVDPRSLAKKRPYVVVWTFVIAMLLTPPDIISQTLLAIPMLLLFEIGIFVGKRIKPRQPDEDVEEDTYRVLNEEEMEQTMTKELESDL
ncbi:MAG: twin-arginine translocase subunit TatC [Gammaproteobacteria bacterium]|nr:twin-arginine translocase subunit TatC [Gammaproteobacteria bacterium]